MPTSSSVDPSPLRNRPPKMKRAHVFLPAQLDARIREVSQEKGVTFGEIVRRALEDFIVKSAA